MKPMLKVAKYLALALGVLLALLLAVVAYLAATFDPNEYKPAIIKLVQEKKQRTLTIPGEIKLSVFPNIGVELGALSISERNSSETFASVDSARVSLALIPLLSQQLVVDQVRIDGLRATIRRDRAGKSNVDDFIGDAAQQPQEEQVQDRQIALDVAGVDISNAHLVYDDRQAGRHVELRDLNLKTGKIADRTPSELKLQAHVTSKQPQVDARIEAATGFTLDLSEGRYRLSGLDAQVKGALAGLTETALKLAGDADLQPADKRFALERVALTADGKRGGQPFELKLDVPQLAVTDTKVSGGKLAGELKLAEGARKMVAAFRAPSFEGTPQAFRLPALELDASVADGELDLRAALAGALSGDIDKLLFNSPQLTLTLSGKQGATPIKGTLSTPLVLDLNRQRLALPRLGADFALPNPAGGTLALKAGGQAAVQWEQEVVSADLSGSLDQSKFDARLGMTGFAKPAYRFDIGIDQLDLDRYRKPAPKTASVAGKGGSAGAAASEKPAAGPDAEQPIDLSALRELRANGSLRVGTLKAAGIHASKLRVDLRAQAGRLALDPLAASLYGGTTNGSATVQAGTEARFALRQTLSNVNVGPLLKDAFESDRLEGRGDVQLDLTATGNTVGQIKRGLNGSARIALHDGAVRGVNVAQMLRSAKSGADALRGKESAQSGTGSAAEKTDFSEMSGSFKIVNGVARNDDLEVKSPLLRMTGSGEIDIGAERLNYVARTTVVPTLQGQGGPELQALKGVTLPVRLSGPFSAIDWKVDVGSVARDLARQKLDVKKDEAKAKLKDELKGQLRGLFGK
jgi:AsmA protein